MERDLVLLLAAKRSCFLLLTQSGYFAHYFLGESIGILLAFAFGVDADDGLGVGLAKVNPVVVEFDFQSVFRVNGLVGIFLFHLYQHAVDVGLRRQLDFIFRDEIVGIRRAQLFDGDVLLGKVR